MWRQRVLEQFEGNRSFSGVPSVFFKSFHTKEKSMLLFLSFCFVFFFFQTKANIDAVCHFIHLCSCFNARWFTRVHSQQEADHPCLLWSPRALKFTPTHDHHMSTSQHETRFYFDTLVMSEMSATLSAQGRKTVIQAHFFSFIQTIKCFFLVLCSSRLMLKRKCDCKQRVKCV